MLAHLLTSGLQNLASAIGFVIPLKDLGDLMVVTLSFTIVGLILFALAFWIIKMVLPFSIRKEIEEDQNISLGIIIASIIIGIALIVAAAIHG